MKLRYLKDLQSKLLGSVTDNDDARKFFATDASIFTLMPEAIVYPKNTADVRKTVQYLAERAQAGKPVPITARGKGTDLGGGALGTGVQLVFPAHMNRLLRLEKDSVTVQPGMLYQTLQQTLHTHGRFLPPYPASIDYSSIGGAVANNAGGEKSTKYGTTRDFVKHLKVVLADGSLIETKRYNAREVNRKKGQADFEGEVYRKLDGLLSDNHKLIKDHKLDISKNSAGYALQDVRRKDGSIDLTPLFVGSQGTLGVITETTLHTVAWNPRSTLLVGYFDSIQDATDAISKLQPLKPSALELVDYYMLDYLRKNRPQDIEGLVPEDLPRIVMFIEFDNISQFAQTLNAKRAQRYLAKHATRVRLSTDPVEQEALWKIRHSAAAVTWMNNGAKQALPIIEDAVVPVHKLPDFCDKTYKLLRKYDLEIAIWGHAGDGNLHLQPFLDLSKKQDIEMLFELTDAFYEMVIKLGGSTSGEHNDGILRGPYLEKLYGKELFGVMKEVKAIFDPQNILNPTAKTGATHDFRTANLRSEYSMKHLYDHLPHT